MAGYEAPSKGEIIGTVMTMFSYLSLAASVLTTNFSGERLQIDSEMALGIVPPHWGRDVREGG